MISAEAAFGDLEKFIKEAESKDTKLILKALIVVIKVILTCRTNTVKIMSKLGIEKDTKKEDKQ